MDLWTTVLAAHVTWVLPFAFLMLYPRVSTFDRALEDAAMDLGATPRVVFFKVLLPMLRAKRLRQRLLFSFTLSFDEFIRTLFVLGPQRNRAGSAFGVSYPSRLRRICRPSESSLCSFR